MGDANYVRPCTACGEKHHISGGALCMHCYVTKQGELRAKAESDREKARALLRAEGATAERARVVKWLRSGRDWNTWRDHAGELAEFDGDHADLLREVAGMLERGEHEEAGDG